MTKRISSAPRRQDLSHAVSAHIAVTAAAPAMERQFRLYWAAPSAAAREAIFDLTGLAGELAPGEMLSITFRLGGPSGSPDTTGEVLLALPDRKQATGSADLPALRPGEEAVLAAIRAACPGCHAAPVMPKPLIDAPADGLAEGLAIRLPERRIRIERDALQPPPWRDSRPQDSEGPSSVAPTPETPGPEILPAGRLGPRASGPEAVPEAQDRSIALPVAGLAGATLTGATLVGAGLVGIDLAAGLAACRASGARVELRLSLTAFTLSPQERAMARHAALLLRADAEAL